MKTLTTNELLFGSFAKRTRSFIFRLALYMVLLSVVIAYCLFMPLYRNNYTNFYESSTYDYFIQETDAEQIKDLKTKSYVEGVFPFSLLIFQLDKRVNSVSNDGKQIALFATGSFEGLKYSSFSEENIISVDQTILADESRNPIIIDYSLSKTEGLGIGDTFSIISDNALKGNVKKFTVGAIYQNHCEFANYDAVMLINEKNNNDLLFLGSEGSFCNLAYVKASNVEEFEAYLQNEFYPHMSFSALEDFHSLPVEEQSGYYQSRAERMDAAEQNLDFSKVGMIVLTLAAFFLIIIIMRRELEKGLENKMYTIAVLYALGMKRRTLWIKMVLKSFLPVVFSIIAACLLNQFIIFEYLTKGFFVPVKTILILGAICLAVIFIVFIILSESKIAKRITPQKVLEQIGQEKGMS